MAIITADFIYKLGIETFFKTIKFTISYTLLIIFPKLYFKLKQIT